MGKIICLMGKSSSGKDTIYKNLMEDKSLGLRKLIPYTTRPMREGEQEGVEYHFTDESGLARLQEEDRVIEIRAYDTVYGVWKYFTVWEESGEGILLPDRYTGSLECHVPVFWP